MSVNYAAGLSPYDHKGKCGLPEIYDAKVDLTKKISKLTSWIKKSKHLVVHTGAGVSTSAGIPDFRGPRGVWTLEAKGQSPEISVTFDAAIPTYTHMALTTLEKMNILKYLITQNVDGLHLRSGFPRDRMSELHGNMFVEQCAACNHKHVRMTAVCSVGEKFTGKTCEILKHRGTRQCRGKLKDTVLDWEANLPEFDLSMAEHQAKLADLSLCLGTTLQIVPAGNLPVLTKKNGGRLVIVNLQPTKQDKHADLIIHAKVDDVMKLLLEKLRIDCETFVQHTVVLNSTNGPPAKPLCPPRKRPRNKSLERCQEIFSGVNKRYTRSTSSTVNDDDTFDVEDDMPLIILKSESPKRTDFIGDKIDNDSTANEEFSSDNSEHSESSTISNNNVSHSVDKDVANYDNQNGGDNVINHNICTKDVVDKDDVKDNSLDSDSQELSRDFSEPFLIDAKDDLKVENGYSDKNNEELAHSNDDSI